MQAQPMASLMGIAHPSPNDATIHIAAVDTIHAAKTMAIMVTRSVRSMSLSHIVILLLPSRTGLFCDYQPNSK